MELVIYFKQFFKYFKEERTPFIIYSGLSLVAALLELFGVALVYPFIIKILSNDFPSDLKSSPFFIGAVIIIMFLLKNIFMIAYTYIQSRYTTNFGMKVQRRLMRYFLGASYQKTCIISLAQKVKIINLLVNNMMNNFVFRLLNLSVNFFIFCFISACLVVKFPVATAVSLIFGLVMIYTQNKFYKPYLKKIAKKISESTLLFNQAFNDALLNIKAVKVSNNEKYFYDNYQNCLKLYSNNNMKNSILSGIPPYVTEPFAIIMFSLIVIIIFGQTYTEPQKLVASLALVGAAIFRLTPAMARIQVNLNGLNSALPLVKEFLDIYEKYRIDNIPEIVQKDFASFKENVELRNICFGYTKDKIILNNFNLIINKGEFIGIAGPSGIGKTTVVDIIAGLYEPISGEILIDGKILNKPLKIGYVPQEFILIKGSIRDNVAFGNPIVDDNKVIDALKKAQLYDFIVDNYEEGIYANPFVDSLGLSQGQKQRLAIARALYSNPDILILDEATSALDVQTEKEICGVLDELKGKTTIIVIAHRLSTIEKADKVVRMDIANV